MKYNLTIPNISLRYNRTEGGLILNTDYERAELLTLMINDREGIKPHKYGAPHPYLKTGQAEFLSLYELIDIRRLEMKLVFYMFKIKSIIYLTEITKEYNTPTGINNSVLYFSVDIRAPHKMNKEQKEEFDEHLKTAPFILTAIRGNEI